MTQQAAPLSAAQLQQRARQADMQATQAIVNNSVFRTQLAGSQTVFPATNPQYILQPINVGLVLRYIIEVTGTITNTGTTTINLTDTGIANLFGPGGVQYIDLNNYTRINTSGLHLTMVANAKRRRPMGGTFQTNTVGAVTPANLSQMLNVAPATWPVFQCPATIASGASGTFRAFFEVPLAYSNNDLRGAVYANVLNAVQQLILTFNTNICAVGTADTTYAIYSGAAGSAASITSAATTVYQDYYDQLPVIQGRLLLPQLSLSTVYEIKQLRNQAIPQNQEYYYPYTNQRSFLSTYAIFNSTGLAAGRTLGTDVAYWALFAANSTYVWKFDPFEAARRSRETLKTDLPAGVYYFPSREHNIATLQYGNVQLTLNASSSNANAYLDIMLEDFALLNTLQSGPSIAQA